MLGFISHGARRSSIDARPMPIDTTTHGHSDASVSLMSADAPCGDEASHREAVGYILDDCFFSIGQAVGNRKTVDQTAVIWWRDRYQAKFMRALTLFGNSWLEDRSRVMMTVRMLGDRAVHYAGDNPSIAIDAAMKASADVERYCALHAKRRHRQLNGERDAHRIYAGYYCTA